ncbi:MAG TPA: PIG-L family deacetylase [Bryobacteraceae bacterium]|nr:PIG-L family deacetylase [Bryobacteraceae bacterium]
MPEMSSSVCLYVVAHQDDWQLFHGQQAFADLQETGNRVVFIYTTAGDAGRTDGWWQARELGALAAQGAPLANLETVAINGHSVSLHEAGSFASYHLRLPDGNVDGSGFPSTGNVSLEKLQIGCISQIRAVDESTIYTSWGDFCATLGEIVGREASQPNVWVNAADWSWNCSPEDHSDHKATGNALRKVFCRRGNVFHRLWFVTYSTKSRPANLSGEPLRQKESVWRAYKQKVEAIADAEFLRWEWAQWGPKNYSRRVLAGEQDIDPCG